jgi:hypothetical protein
MWNTKSSTVSNINSVYRLHTPLKTVQKEEEAVIASKIKERENGCIDLTPKPPPRHDIIIVRMCK